MKHEANTRAMRASLAVLASAALGLVLAASPAGAARKSASAAPIARRLEPAEVQDRSSQSSDFIRVAGLFDNDEEEKARQQHEDSQDAAVQQLRQRVEDLEDSLRRQTGQVEQLTHRVQELNQKMDRMQKDFDYKLCSMAQQQMGASTDEGFNCNTVSDQSASMLPPNNTANNAAMNSAPSDSSPPPTNAPAKLAPPPGTLGTLPGNTRLPQSPNEPAATQTPSASRPEFDAAMDLLAKTQYAEARSAFRAFADAHPKDDLTPQAVYWVGNIAFVQKDYQGAKFAFAEELKKYPGSPRAPESMLKLGQSFLAMNQSKEGCTTLGLLPSKYPNATKAIKDKAVAARKAAVCK
ncbi:MAG: tol-pal system protein YbgF [Proteobacteria bacterium]|nr:tol-pal system protein YbgF [Pseudomonadota bacterium]